MATPDERWMASAATSGADPALVARRLSRATTVDTFTMRPAPPFRLELTVWALRRRPDNAIDRWDGTTYRRVMRINGDAVDVAVRQTGPPHGPELRVTIEGPSAKPGSKRTEVADTLERCLGLTVDLAGFYRLAEADSLLGPLAKRFRGMRPPRFPSLFETIANAVSCQQLSITVGIRLLNRLAKTYGQSAGISGAQAFPGADQLVGASPEDLRKLGYSRRKGQVLVGLAEQIRGGALDVDDLTEEDDAGALARLCRLDGVGRWSAEYILLRGLGRVHVFPGDDVGARNKLRRWLSLPEPLDYAAVTGLVERWQPYAGLVYFHLLLDSLTGFGWLSEQRPRQEPPL